MPVKSLKRPAVLLELRNVLKSISIRSSWFGEILVFELSQSNAVQVYRDTVFPDYYNVNIVRFPYKFSFKVPEGTGAALFLAMRDKKIFELKFDRYGLQA